MASLTIRKLDDAVKAYLRLRSAKNGRSVEEEVRVILRETIQGRPFEFASLPSRAASADPLPLRSPAIARSTPARLALRTYWRLVRTLLTR